MFNGSFPFYVDFVFSLVLTNFLQDFSMINTRTMNCLPLASGWVHPSFCFVLIICWVFCVVLFLAVYLPSLSCSQCCLCLWIVYFALSLSVSPIIYSNSIGGAIVSLLSSSVVCRGLYRVKQKAIKYVASPLSTQHEGERAKTGWFGIRIMCSSGATCLSTNCRVSELALCKSN